MAKRRLASLLTLPLLGVAALAQSPSPWTERAGALGAALTESPPEAQRAVYELEQLRAELEPELMRSPAPARDAVRGYLLSCLYLARADPALRSQGPAPEKLLAGAEAVARDFGGAQERALVVLEFAAFLRDRGRLTEAVLRLEAELDERASPARRPELLLALAELERKLGQLDAALARLDAAEAALLDQDAASPLAAHAALRSDLHGARGRLWLQLGLADLARAAFAAQAESARAIGYARGELLAALGASDLGLLVEDFEGVITRLEPWLTSTPAGTAASDRAHARVLLGAAFSELEREDPARPRRAEKELRSALRAPQLIDDHALGAELHLADLLLRQAPARHQDIERLLASANERLDRREGSGGGSTSLERALWAALRGRLALDAPSDAPRAAQALRTLRAAYEGFLATWASTPQRPGGVGFLQVGTRRLVLDELIRLSVAVEGESGLAQALHDLCRAQALGSLARRQAARAPELDELRERLTGERRGVLVYLPSMDRGHLIGFDATELWHVEIPSRDDVVALLAELQPVWARASSAPPSTQASARAERLVAEVSARLLPARARAALARWDAVTVCGAELFGTLPLAALPVDAERRLGTHWALSRTPSLPLTARLATAERSAGPEPSHPAARPAPELVVVVANQALESFNEPPLAFGAGERELLCAGFDPDATRLLFGPDATPQALSATASARILSVVAHGTYQPNTERGAALILAGSTQAASLFACADAESVAAPPLVLLSACGAARGPARLGDDGVSHFGGAFLAAGAQAVLLSPFPLAYGPQLELVSAFQRHVASGQRADEALRLARADLASRFSGLDDGRLVELLGWGALRVFPERTPAPAPRASTPARRLPAGLAAGGLALALLLRRRRRKARP